MTTMLVPFRTRYPNMFGDFRREIDHVMESFLGSENNGGSAYFSPLCNLAETQNHYDISIDLPGVVLDDVDVELKKGELWITGERKFEELSEGQWHRYECPRGRFQRIIRLSAEVDMDKVDAEFRDGVLHVMVPKAEAAKPKRIRIRG